jgi:hypothetical protein
MGKQKVVFLYKENFVIPKSHDLYRKGLVDHDLSRKGLVDPQQIAD